MILQCNFLAQNGIDCKIISSIWLSRLTKYFYDKHDLDQKVFNMSHIGSVLASCSVVAFYRWFTFTGKFGITHLCS